MEAIGRKIVCTKEKTLKGSPSEIFPLLCPVLEERWIPGWEYDLLYTQSGVNETGCIFRENMSGPNLFEEPIPAIWTTILHDPEKTRVEFVICYEGRGVSWSSVQLSPAGEGLTKANWRKELTSLSPKNDRFSDQELHDKMLVSLDFLADALSHYCGTGTMLA
ncbi:hypothetical protein [Desulfatibacillum aliphaticivorans]|uniref:hypothetical protein n=1 Tax=Desulfatibacillum aliphaticivorans TaxID=218208 RepID=UPI00041F4477|nr:hypothetical protein [Desulfatibacillum aliphaticivorans]